MVTNEVDSIFDQQPGIVLARSYDVAKGMGVVLVIKVQSGEIKKVLFDAIEGRISPLNGSVALVDLDGTIHLVGIDTGTIAKFGPGEKIVFSPDGSRIAYVRRPNDFGCQMGRPIGLGVYIIATGEDTLPFPFKDCKKEVTKIPVGTIIRGYPIRL
jgi:hypothetical protein